MNANNHVEPELLKQHTPLVTAMVRQFTVAMPTFFSAEHLHGLGLIALQDAARCFPPSSRLSFAAFASIHIHGALLGEIRRAKNWFQTTSANANSTSALV
jgi:DNA-directed RNA polymerase specialized sigma subunit